jgi:hypothetical protein
LHQNLALIFPHWGPNQIDSAHGVKNNRLPENERANTDRIRIESQLSPGKYTRPLADDKRPTLRNTASRETPARIGKRIVSRFHAVQIHNMPVNICQVWGTTDENYSRLARRSIGRTDFGSGIRTRCFGSRSSSTGSQRTGTCQEAAQATQAPRQARRCGRRRFGRWYRGQGPGELKRLRGRDGVAATLRASSAMKKARAFALAFFCALAVAGSRAVAAH